MGTKLKIANGAEHRALIDARLVKDVFFRIFATHTHRQKVGDLAHLSLLFSFATMSVFPIAPQCRFEAFAMARA